MSAGCKRRSPRLSEASGFEILEREEKKQGGGGEREREVKPRLAIISIIVIQTRRNADEDGDCREDSSVAREAQKNEM